MVGTNMWRIFLKPEPKYESGYFIRHAYKVKGFDNIIRERSPAHGYIIKSYSNGRKMPTYDIQTIENELRLGVLEVDLQLAHSDKINTIIDKLIKL